MNGLGAGLAHKTEFGLIALNFVDEKSVCQAFPKPISGLERKRLLLNRQHYLLKQLTPL